MLPLAHLQTDQLHALPGCHLAVNRHHSCQKHGSNFGPKKSQESAEVLVMFQGIDNAKRMTQEATSNTER
jgi:hypothetical protein